MQGAYEARLGQPGKSALAEHKFEMGHNIRFGSTTVLDKALGYMSCLIKEAVEIRLQPRNINRDRGFHSHDKAVPS